MYAIKKNGEFRAISKDMPLQPDEERYDAVPQWVYEKMQIDETNLEKALLENAWRDQEIDLISNQLMAMEEHEATGEDTGALPGTRVQWLSYRTKVRGWKDGAEYYPDSLQRPSRPQ